MNLEHALKASKNGAIAAFISAIFTLAIVLYALGSNADGFLGIWNDPAVLGDVVIIFVCAFGMLRKSRAAAVTMCVYWIFAKIFMFIESGGTTGLITSLVFLYFYGKAVQGTFAYHRIKKEEDPSYQAAPRWYYYVGIPSLVIILLLSVFGMLTMTDYVPSTEIITGSEVSTEDRDRLISNGVLYQDEQIEHFYSYGLLSVLEGGNILTDRAVITYFINDDDQLTTHGLTFDQIKSIELYQDGNFLNDAIYKIDSYDEDVWITVELSTESRGDVRFIEALRDKVRLATVD